MKRVIYAFSTALTLTYAATAIAQSAPLISHLTPLQRQQISQDLVPSSAQDFFRAGQANLEQEIRWLTRQRSPNETLLKVSPQVLPGERGEKHLPLQPDRTK